jgi:hypothetical protein
MTLVALLLGLAPTVVFRYPELAAFGVLLVINMIFVSAIIRNVASK